MKNNTGTVLLLGIFLLTSCFRDSGNITYVDPMIGTGLSPIHSIWRSEGGTYPGAVAPNGMVQITPQTSSDSDWLKGYYYHQDSIRCFSLCEHFSGWPSGSAGKGKIMPFCLQEDLNKLHLDKLSSAFEHRKEKAEPGYYAVYLEQPGIQCEFTALTRSVIGRVTFNAEGRKGFFIEASKDIRKKGDRTLQLSFKSGRGEMGNADDRIYLFMKFDHDFRLDSAQAGYRLLFPDLGDQLVFKYAGSYTSALNAKENLEGEISGWDFQRTRRRSRALWEKELSCVQLSGGREEDKLLFYTALYHASLLPLVASDLNGEFPGWEKNPPLKKEELHYQYFSPWDAFRSLHPLLNFLKPEKSGDMMRSMLRFYRHKGRLPEPEVMTGVHCSSLFLDALAHGINDFDLRLAFKGLSELILEKPYFRPALAVYDSLGYVPYPLQYATTATLEFAWNDWCMARLAECLGQDSLAGDLDQRSLNYRNNYHPEERFMRTRLADGSWSEASLYAEADAWNSSWMVYHDVQGLINLMGGSGAFCEHLDRNLDEGHFILDNENPMHFPFLYAWTDSTWKSPEKVRKVLRKHFSTEPGGIPGNDDYGAMSSWLLWSSLGLYPACPGSSQLVLTGPLFNKLIIRRDDGKVLRIFCASQAETEPYIQKVFLGSEPHPLSWVNLGELLSSGRITFEMSSRPNTQWAVNRKPYSLTDNKARFRIGKIKMDTGTVRPGDKFQMKLDIRNHGASGSYQLKIKENGRSLHQEFLLLKKGEEKEWLVELQLYRPGIHLLDVAGQVLEVEILDTPDSLPVKLQYRHLELQSLCESGDSIRCQLEAFNPGGWLLREIPSLWLDGQPYQDLEELELEPGEIARIEGKLAALPPGFHRLSVNENGPSFLFKVIAHASESLVAGYSFDQGDQIAEDVSGFGHHGTIVGTVRWVEGMEGEAVRMEQGYIRLPEVPALRLEGHEITVMSWYRPMEEKGQATMISRGSFDQLKLSNPWQVKWNIGGWGKAACHHTVAAKNGSLPEWEGEWHHFAGSLKNDTLKLYVDGHLVQSQLHRGGIGKNPYAWFIGSNMEYPVDRNPRGIIDEVRIYGRALDAREIKRLATHESLLNGTEIHPAN